MQSRIKHLLKHFALVLKAKLNQLKPFVRFVFHPSTLLSSPTYRIIKGLRIQTLFILLYASFSCPYFLYFCWGATAPHLPSQQIYNNWINFCLMLRNWYQTVCPVWMYPV